MTTLDRFKLDDLLIFNTTNLDPLTETYNLQFYLDYMSTWPEYFEVAKSCEGRVMGYAMGKSEGEGDLWHGHVTAVTVAPEFRRQGLAKCLMSSLEETTAKSYNGYFVDLFVRSSNKVAIGMYERMGYSVYRTVLKYYSDNDEDAYDMRKAMPRDPEGKSCVPLKEPITPDELEW
ncbi:hypothetical protein TrVE_jg11833 [Triparma verrucosa]|uniref:N-acetyltransferase domain-containing protein n=2 Tax=Triparma TaxID=722752 RepID=A0A9W7BS25_9STRA|nr:hypothetical protein TrVE_jg11833 [Triparma verrucosa]GMH91315.1 hypothetical protein TrST_g2152 [Triparma strigata]